MRFYSGKIPQVYTSKNFTFRPLTPTYTELDFEALMDTKEILRQWSNSPWPEDDFALEANRADLQRHDDEFQNNIAYTYTVLNPEEDRVEGCLYIYALFQILKWHNAPEDILAQVGDGEAHLGFWIRGDRLADEGKLLHEIVAWLDDAWAFSHVSYSTYDTSDRQKKLFEALGMSLRFRLPKAEGLNLCFYHIV